jgi:hypothetical protein
MILPESSTPSPDPPVTRSKRDWLLLPALCLATIVVLAVSTEVVARLGFPTLRTLGEDCMVFDDAATGARGRANSVCYEKLPDGKLTEYRFNSCGHRAGMECGPKPAGVYRIVMIGSSFATGMRVPLDETFGWKLPQELQRITGRSIQLYNEGMPWRGPRVIAGHFDQVLAQQPDLILWVLTPTDFLDTPIPVRPRGPAAQAGTAWVPHWIQDFLVGGQESGFLLKHLLFESRTLYVKAALMRSVDMGYLNKPLTPEWQHLLANFNDYAASIASQAQAAHVPLVAVLLPMRVQVALQSMHKQPPGVDPSELGSELRHILENHGEVYLDILPGFSTIPDPELGYFSIDGHPNSEGHAVLTSLLARALTSGPVPALHRTASSEVQ